MWELGRRRYERKIKATRGSWNKEKGKERKNERNKKSREEKRIEPNVKWRTKNDMKGGDEENGC